MTQPPPTAEELLAAVREFLSDELAPQLDGRLRFHARVAANVLGIVERELRDGPAGAAAEGARLAALLGEEGSPAELAARLAALLRSGEVATDDPAVLDHLRRTAAEDVAIANPRWIEPPT